MREIPNTPVSTERQEIGKKELTNLPCNVEITIKINDGETKKFVLEDEADARNLLARMVPVGIIVNNTTELLSHITDGSQPLFDYFYGEAKNQGLSLPENF